MITTHHIADGKPTTVARYTDLHDVSVVTRKAKETYDPPHSSHDNWFGGTMDEYYRACEYGVTDYAKQAKALAGNFTNIALEGHGYDYDYNHRYGYLDPGAYIADQPDPFYGVVPTMTERAPVNVYLDTWVSASCTLDNIIMRGIAAMALVEALTVFRPVKMLVVDGASVGNTNLIQVCPVPTHPMDMAKATFMACSPMYTRIGMIANLKYVGKNKSNHIPPLKQGKVWQTNELGNWVAALEGVEDVVHLPMMQGDDPRFETQQGCIKWVMTQIERFK